MSDVTPLFQDPPRREQTEWFHEHVLPHEPDLRAWLRRHYPTIPDVDDVVQECYLRVIRAHAAGPIESTKPYLFGIAKHVAAGVFRKNRRFPETFVNEIPPFRRIEEIDETCDTVETVSHSQERHLVTEAIKTLPGRCQEILVLRVLHGFSYQEIAVHLDIAEETVRVQMARGMKKCIQFMRDRGIEGKTS